MKLPHQVRSPSQQLHVRLPKDWSHGNEKNHGHKQDRLHVQNQNQSFPSQKSTWEQRNNLQQLHNSVNRCWEHLTLLKPHLIWHAICMNRLCGQTPWVWWWQKPRQERVNSLLQDVNQHDWNPNPNPPPGKIYPQDFQALQRASHVTQKNPRSTEQLQCNSFWWQNQLDALKRRIEEKFGLRTMNACKCCIAADNQCLACKVGETLTWLAVPMTGKTNVSFGVHDWLHCAKSYMPFELFVNENYKL